METSKAYTYIYIICKKMGANILSWLICIYICMYISVCVIKLKDRIMKHIEASTEKQKHKVKKRTWWERWGSRGEFARHMGIKAEEEKRERRKERTLVCLSFKTRPSYAKRVTRPSSWHWIGAELSWRDFKVI